MLIHSGAKAEPINILMAEDNDADARLAEEALVEGKIKNNLFRVKDGVEAMAFLKNEPPYTDAPRPDLVLLDLNMPRKNGMEVLGEVKNDPSLSGIPVVVLTTSSAENDIVESYNLKASCYIRKPVDFEQFIDVVKEIEHFWFSVVTLPHSAK